jgi:hypothetical protein
LVDLPEKLQSKSDTKNLEVPKKEFGNKKQMICEFCNKSLICRFKADLKRHYKTCKFRKNVVEVKKDKPDKQMICELCPNLGLTSENHWQNEIRSHRVEKHKSGDQFCCLYCDEKLKNWNILKFHIDAKHSEHGEKNFSCDGCGKYFMFEFSYKEHKRTQKNCRDYKSNISKNPDLRPAGYNDGQIICEICPILDLASSEQEIQSHRLEKHKNGKEFYCFPCDQKFRVWVNLKQHFDRSHFEDREKKFFCPDADCDKSFVFECSYKLHLRSVLLLGHIFLQYFIVTFELHICGFLVHGLNLLE